MAGYNFTTASATSRIDRILEVIAMGFNSASSIGEKLGMTKGTYGHYLTYMKVNELIHVTSFDPGERRGGYVPIYALGKAPSEEELLFGRDEYDHEIRIMTKDWQDGMAHRDPLDAAFFGSVKQDSAGLNPGTLKEEKNAQFEYSIDEHRRFCRTIATVGTGFPVPATRQRGESAQWALERSVGAHRASASPA